MIIGKFRPKSVWHILLVLNIENCINVIFLPLQMASGVPTEGSVLNFSHSYFGNTGILL